MTLVMGILNVTPDSFSDGGRFVDPERAVAHASALTRQGAAIVDVGGESTRPGAERTDPKTEQERVLPVLRAIHEIGIPVSIDTMNAATAAEAIAAGARFVNDVSGGQADPDMFAAVAETNAEIVIGHWRGPSSNMYGPANYTDVLREVLTELRARVDAAAAAGIPPARVIVDPGIGFGKTAEQSWAVLRGLDRIVASHPRVLVGTSRKSLLSEALSEDPAAVTEQQRDLATAVTSVLASRAGAWMVRVHDVAVTRDALLTAMRWEDERRWTNSDRSH